jgi:hypothetical protein
MRAKHIIGDFEGFFERAKTFLTPKLSCAQRRAIWGFASFPELVMGVGSIHGKAIFMSRCPTYCTLQIHAHFPNVPDLRAV